MKRDVQKLGGKGNAHLYKKTEWKKEKRSKIISGKITKKQLEELWKEVVKAKAGYKSELSGVEGRQIGGEAILCAHHVVGKTNDALRFLMFENGICIENGKEHIFGVHNKNDVIRARYYQDLIIEKVGQERYNKLSALRKFSPRKKTDLAAAKLFLQQELVRKENKQYE